MRDLQKVFNSCIEKMDKIGIDYGNITEITVNTRAKKRLGQCCSHFIGFSSNNKPRYTYKINISSILLDERVPIESLENTIIHEILHTCPSCLDHGKEWKRRADKVNREYGYNIKRTVTLDESGVSEVIINDYERKPKYMCQCKKCGSKVSKYRMCDFVKYPQFYKCAKCGGDFVRII